LLAYIFIVYMYNKAMELHVQEYIIYPLICWHCGLYCSVLALHASIMWTSMISCRVI